MNSGVTIRIGAAHNEVRAGEVVIDMASASKTERYEVRKTLIETLRSRNFFGKEHNRKYMKAKRRGKRNGH